MKRFISCLLLINVLISCSPQVDQEQIKASILSTNTTFMENITGKNAEAVADLYTKIVN